MNRLHDTNYEPCDPEDIEEEQNNFLSILAAFKNYRWFVFVCQIKKNSFCNDQLFICTEIIRWVVWRTPKNI